jgi:triosephosphate isomerase
LIKIDQFFMALAAHEMKKYIIANWKSNKNLSEVVFWLNNFPNGAENLRVLHPLEIILAPPYPFLVSAQTIIEERQLPIKLAVQDLSAFGKGAYTGEVSAFNLQDLNVQYAILGHSERRRFLKESNQLIADKITEALSWHIKPILCLDKPDFVKQARFLPRQVLPHLFIAYEPVTAIGSGQAEDTHNLLSIKKELESIYQVKTFIYGGSVNAGNIGSFLQNTDGVLLGGASLELTDFVNLLFAASDNLRNSDYLHQK